MPSLPDFIFRLLPTLLHPTLLNCVMRSFTMCTPFHTLQW